MFEVLTPLSYWILAIVWATILVLYLVKYRVAKPNDKAISTLLFILALDAFRTVFESTYFGLYFNAKLGLLPSAIADFLSQPVILFIPKALTLVIGLIILFMIHRRWAHWDLRESHELIRDLQEAMRNAEQNAATLAKLSQAVEQSPASVVITDIDGNIEYANSRFEEITGYRLAEVLGKNPRLLSSGESSKEGYESLWSTIRAGGKWRGEFRNKRKDGSLYWESASISVIRDANGNITHYLSVKEDITKLKNLEEQTGRLQKLEAVGQLTSGIAHDFNNILGIVQGNLELLQRSVVGNEKALGRANKALRAVERGTSLVRKLLAFSRKDVHQVSLVVVNEVIVNLSDLLTKSLTASITLETHLADDLWPIAVDPSDFEDALLNLCLNARDAMENGGILTIKTARRTLDDQHVPSPPEGRFGDYVMISITDTGTGMTEELKAKIFEPFFSTKEAGKGTGLGLSMVYGFVQRSGGHIEVDSAPGKGSTFSLFLPRMTEPEAGMSDTGVNRLDLPGGAETILIVDDEQQLLEIAAAYLQALGYQILTANRGADALRLINEGRIIDLLLCDVVMPGELDGYRTAAAAHAARPALKILLTSGYTKLRTEPTLADQDQVADLNANLLRKPYNQLELALAVRRALDEGNCKRIRNPS